MLASFFTTFVTTYLSHLALMAIAMLGAKYHFKTPLNAKWLSITAISYFGYLFIDYHKLMLVDFNLFKPLISTLLPNWPTLFWPWDVTFTAIIYCMALIALINKIDINQINNKNRQPPLLKQIGLTLKQHKNSLKPCLIVFSLLLVARYYLSLIVGGDDGVRDPEELLFLLLSEGLDKTLFFFGLLPVLFNRVFAHNPIIWQHKYCKINLTFAASALTFATFNGLNTIGFTQNLIFISSFILMGIYALIFLWMRQITGSLILPVSCYGVLMFFSQLL